MKLLRIIFFCLILLGVYFIIQKDQINTKDLSSVSNSFREGFDFITAKVHDLKLTSKKQDTLENVEKPDLKIPNHQALSVHNIEIGNTKESVEKQMGKAQRSTYNEYGAKWYTYHKNYQNFFMVTYDSNHLVAGLYTNQNLVSSKQGIQIGNSKQSVEKKLGTPLKGIKKGFVLYQMQNNGEYNIYEMDSNYVTVFFDKHNKNTLTAVQIISKNLEENKKNFYPQSSKRLTKGFEYQLFDLTNAARVKNDLPPLSWNAQVKVTAQKHSDDMASHQYFSHTDLNGGSPFDRMKNDGITFMTAGENIAEGQISSVYAHEGLMNSLGHRKNILNNKFDALGVGVAFDQASRPFFTENFLGN